jgi:arylsulfatase A-like enzyme
MARREMKPNIVFIVADDLGYADLGCYGGRNAAFGPVSPVLDRLAAGGIRFTDGYANSPVCSPTRFALATARYQYRLRGASEEPLHGGAAQRLGLPPSHPTVASLLKEAGYRTALVGKWHLGNPPEFGPLQSGYEEFFGPLSGGVDYWTHCNPGGRHDLWLGDARAPQEGYLTDLLSRRAVDFIDRVAGARAPFFLSLHYTAPHWPWETRDDPGMADAVAGNLYHLDGGNVETYRRMIHHMDEGIGWVMDALRRHGVEQDTLVVFTSDNGGERFSDNWPLVGGKMDLTEGGIRVPWIAHWPAFIPPGSVCAQHCMTMDWAATVLAAAGVRPHAEYPLDGVSLLPVLQQPAATFARPMHWRMKHRGQRALRDGDWKYLRVDGHDYLFNVADDARERASLGPRDPERLRRMREQWQSWNEDMPGIPEDAAVTLVYGPQDMPQR